MNHTYHIHHIRRPEIDKEIETFKGKVDYQRNGEPSPRPRAIRRNEEEKDPSEISVLKKLHPRGPLDKIRNKSTNPIKRPSELTDDELTVLRALELRDKIIETLYQQKLAEKSNEYRKFIFDRSPLRYDNVVPKVYEKSHKKTTAMRNGSRSVTRTSKDDEKRQLDLLQRLIQ